MAGPSAGRCRGCHYFSSSRESRGECRDNEFPSEDTQGLQADLPAITAMLADDVLGAARERLGFEATHEGMKLELAAA